MSVEKQRFVDNHMFELAGVAAGAIALGYVAYKKFCPTIDHPPGENYFEIIQNLDSIVRSELGDEIEYLMLGGSASAALADPDTKVNLNEKRIIPPPTIHKPQFRANGTKADIDILVISKDEATVHAFRSALSPNLNVINSGSMPERAAELAKPGTKLKIGVTGLRSADTFEDKPTSVKDKAIRMFAKDWVSHRLEGDDFNRRLVISDLSVDIPVEYFEPWDLVVADGSTVPIPHPLIQVLCYASRACHGVRKRDIEKVNGIMENVGHLFGARLVWGKDHETATLLLDKSVSPGIDAALEFCNKKNELRWKNTRSKQGAFEAGVLATKIATHRILDSHQIFTQFGQGGWLYDRVLSRFTGEDQTD